MSLSDDEIYDRLHKAMLVLGKGEGTTGVGGTALKAVRKVIQGMMLAIVASNEGVDFRKKEDEK